MWCKNIIFILFIIFTPLFNTAQQQVIDSLKQKAEIEKNDSLKAILFNKIGKEYWYINTDSSIQFTNKALKIAQQKKINGVLPYCYNNFGVIEYLKGNYSNALNQLFKGLPYSRKNHIIHGLLLNNIGMSYHELKDLNKAQEYYKKLLKSNVPQRIRREWPQPITILVLSITH